MRLSGWMVVCIIVVAAVSFAGTNSNGVVSVGWTYPSTYMSGLPLTDLGGAKVYYGLGSSNYVWVDDVPGGVPGGQGRHTVSNLEVGTLYFLNGTAYNTAGLESDFCNEISKVAYPAGAKGPRAPSNLGVKWMW